MRELNVSVLTDAVAELCISANKILPEALTEKIKKAWVKRQKNYPKV